MIFFLLIMALFLFLSACSNNSLRKEEGQKIADSEGRLFQSWDEVEKTEYEEHEIVVENHSLKIWGIAYIPDTEADTYPLVICSHGLGGNYHSCMEYAELLASHGIATYCFDFCGGGGNRSDGSILDMSLLTEADDLSAIISDALTWDFVDKDKIILLGESQGGAASAIAAARNSEIINGLILCYPAFLVHDAVHERFDSLDEIPDSYFFEWLTLGKRYAEDVWNYDVYEEIGNFTNPVLLMHGNRDSIVPISYAEKAANTYSDVEYYIIDGGGHGFYSTALEDAFIHILDYLQKIRIWDKEY